MIENGSDAKWPKRIIVHTDGASRGNPGPASIGLLVLDENSEVVYEQGRVLGVQTNNYAEYMAVVESLTLAVKNKVDGVTIRSDSELLIRQLQGQYKVKSEGLKPLYQECLRLLKKISDVRLEHVRREQNKRADELANMALDES